MPGMMNRILVLDLTLEKIEEKSLEPKTLKAFIGGSSLAAQLFLDCNGHEFEPLAPQSPLIVMTGPLVGTNFPGSSRFCMCARSPLTGIWGESASGGAFGAVLKKAGFDGILITGKSSKPIYIVIEDGKASIEDAGELWGQDTYDTIDALKEKHAGKKTMRVLAIGPAGENRVAFASVSNDKAHYFGRTGMGAVMGSKNIKAMAVRGSSNVPLADEAAYRDARKAAIATIKESMICASFHDLGTAAAMDIGTMTGDVPMQNWRLGEDDQMAAALGGPAIHETILKGRAACFACPIGCKPVVEVDDPKYGVPKGPGPEYETCGTFGTMIMNDNLNAAAYINSLCNRLGLDTITCGATIAFMMECFENDLLTAADLDGLELTWGNVDAAIEMVQKIAYRTGFGNIAAGGSRALAERLGGQASDFEVTVKGLELPMHDPRAFHGLGLAYMNSNRGACHLQHAVQAVEQGMVSWTEAGLEDDYEATVSEGKAKMVSISEDIGQMANAVCVCHFVQWAMGLEHLLNGFNAVTGYGFDLETFLECGQRAWVLKRALNNLMGINAADDCLPKRILTPLKEGAAAGSKPDEDLMRAEYYQIRNLDENGWPKPALLKSLDLEFLQDKFAQ